ncbi:hypothetical protein LINPERHAP1_LOCUS21201 [Linum perenne]
MACFAMHPDKAPGPDGLNPAFYQKFWDVVGADIIADCQKWLAHGEIVKEVRATNVVLLPKQTNPTRMGDLRHIVM